MELRLIVPSIQSVLVIAHYPLYPPLTFAPFSISNYHYST